MARRPGGRRTQGLRISPTALSYRAWSRPARPVKRAPALALQRSARCRRVTTGPFRMEKRAPRVLRQAPGRFDSRRATALVLLVRVLAGLARLPVADRRLRGPLGLLTAAG